MSAAELLQQAATLIETHGHTRHGYVSLKGKLCMLGAIIVADNPDADPAGCTDDVPWLVDENYCDEDPYPEHMRTAIGALAAGVSARLGNDDLTALYGQLIVRDDPMAGTDGDALDRAIVACFNDRSGMNQAGAVKALRTAAAGLA